MNDDNTTITMLTKLFPISIVANNLFGLSNKLRIKLPVLDSSPSMSFLSCGDKEKKATSAPDIKAEQSNKIKII